MHEHLRRRLIEQGGRRPIPSREAVVHELGARIGSGTSSQFDRSFLSALNTNPELSLAQAWQQTENFYAGQSRTSPRQNPYIRRSR